MLPYPYKNKCARKKSVRFNAINTITEHTPESESTSTQRTTVLNVVQLNANASANAEFPALLNSSPPTLTHFGSIFPAKIINPAKMNVNPKKTIQLMTKRKKKLTLNIQCKYTARLFWLLSPPGREPTQQCLYSLLNIFTFCCCATYRD